MTVKQLLRKIGWETKKVSKLTKDLAAAKADLKKYKTALIQAKKSDSAKKKRK